MRRGPSHQLLRSRLAIFLVPALFVACSLSDKGGPPSISVDLSGLRDQSQYSLLNGGSSFITTTPSPGVPPVLVTDFACYGVNVTGPGIADSSPHPEVDPQGIFAKSLAGLHSCAYRGVLSPPLQLLSAGGAEANLQIPPGAVRLVQVVGINSTTICQSGILGGEENNSGGTTHISNYFEIGRAVLRDVYSDRSVGVMTDWPTTNALRAARALDCGDGVGPTSITITSTSVYVSVGGTPHTLQLTAVANYGNGSIAEISTAPGMVWSSSNPTMASVSPSGLVTGLSAGVLNVTATFTPPNGGPTLTATVQGTVSP